MLLALDALILLLWLPSGTYRLPRWWLSVPCTAVAILVPLALLAAPPQLINALSDQPHAPRPASHDEASDTCPHCQETIDGRLDCVRQRRRAPEGRCWAFIAIGEATGFDLLAREPLRPEIPTWRIRQSRVNGLPCALLLDDGRLTGRWDAPPGERVAP